MDDLLKKYKAEISEDVKIDQLIILDKQMRLPAIKHRWVSRLIDAKQSLNKLQKRKKETRRSVLEALESSMPKGLPKTAIDSRIEASEVMQAINDEIDETELLVLYLEKVEKIFTDMNFSITNCVSLIKMETT